MNVVNINNLESRVDRQLTALVKHLPTDVFDTWSVDAMVQYVAETGIDGAERDAIRRRVETVRANRAALKRCLALPVIEQRTPPWYAARENILTASDLGAALGKSKYGTRAELLLQKTKVLERSFDVGARRAMDNGVMFEPMALRAYQESRGDIPAYNLGLLIHPTLKCFGASPDGLTALGCAIEIKAPLYRKLTGEIPEHYYYQMQGQMATCGVSETDYIEAKFLRYTPAAYIAEVAVAAQADPMAALSHHGVTVRLVRMEGDVPNNVYLHSPPGLTPVDAIAWADRRAWHELQNNADMELGERVYWRCAQLDVQRVRFDAEAWATTVEPAIQAFHDERQVMAARLASGMMPYEGYQVKVKRTRVTKPKVDVVPDFVDDDDV